MYQSFYRFLWILEIIWYTLRVEALGCTRVFIGFSGFSKISGTLRRMRLLSAPEFYRILWIFKIIWYTWENETPACTRILRIFKKSW